MLTMLPFIISSLIEIFILLAVYLCSNVLFDKVMPMGFQLSTQWDNFEKNTENENNFLTSLNFLFITGT